MARPLGKSIEIDDFLRHRITTGQLKPGDRVPSYDELQKRFSAGRRTVAKVMQQLSEEGFLVSAGRSGTFVRQHPPHLYRLAVCFREASGLSAYKDALLADTLHNTQHQPYSFTGFFAVTAAQAAQTDRELLKQMQQRLYAGLVLAFPAGYLSSPDLLNVPDVPVVELAPPIPAFRTKVVGSLDVDSMSFLKLAVRILLRQGRRRIAFFWGSGTDCKPPGELMAWMARQGIQTRPYWSQVVIPQAGNATRSSLEVFFRLPKADRPDGLVITDDNLVPVATRVLRELNVNVPGELAIVGHANFPYLTRSHLPITRAGFEIPRLIDHCIELVRNHHQRGPLKAEHHRLKAIEESQTSTTPPCGKRFWTRLYEGKARRE